MCVDERKHKNNKQNNNNNNNILACNAEAKSYNAQELPVLSTDGEGGRCGIETHVLGLPALCPSFKICM